MTRLFEKLCLKEECEFRIVGEIDKLSITFLTKKGLKVAGVKEEKKCRMCMGKSALPIRLFNVGSIDSRGFC